MDRDLEDLKKFTDFELKYLFKMMKKQAHGTCSLEDSIEDDIVNHVEEIADELCRFGGNTFANCWRHGHGITYFEILKDVCDYIKIKVESSDDRKKLEEKIVLSFVEKEWSQLDFSEKKKVLEELCKQGLLSNDIRKFPENVLKKMSVLDLVVSPFFSNGRILFSNERIVRIFAESLCIPITIINSLAEPAMRVLLPCVFYIAVTRRRLGGSEL